ncbi:hypothetical protein GCM10010112_22180 [Actinoplanes lobatus]|uniref:Uncharacterized protein n=1 Tax=Actinoplanes lobatus TaxID=113568 RepID=A0A7W7MIC7_9ACTN|nr:hypothetical protein [Actinoplanes lobatus]MBB4751261.1 hypothetical protein [Actinoplanes lobatus]GGN63176.1 hypothetical protein GCM10010112_22180 [Actinoplanes lobatus]GIE44797.1 hypothetical protein Alo02nite_76950 [Actinoplanes lobatus]
MAELAPTAAETVAVTVWVIAQVVATLGLLGGLALLHRNRAPAGERPAPGLYVLAAAGTVALALATRADFAGTVSGARVTLSELRIYWVAYLIGAGLLTVLTWALLVRRRVLRLVAGPSALAAGGLLLGLLLTLYTRIQQADARRAAAVLPTLKPTGDVSVGDFGVQARLGWVLAFTGTVLLMLVAVLLVAGRYELLVAGILAVAVTLPAVPAPPGTSFWGLRDGAVEGARYWAVEVGGSAPWWSLTLLGLAALLCAIPFLPPGFRGCATVLAAGAPIWIAVAWLLASIDFDVNLARALSGDGFALASRRLGVFAYLFMVAGMVAVPVVSVRAWWTAAVRNEPRPWRRHAG